MSKVVVLWSGGVDSTAALYDVLKNHRDIVFAHHIHFKNRERRWEAEKDAVDKMLPWLRKNVRDFEYSESTLEMDLKFHGWDIMTSMYIGGLVVRDKKCARLVLATNGDDYKQTSWRTTLSQLLAVITNLTHPTEHQSFPYLWQMASKTSKKDLWNSLPEFLKENIWSCRKPNLNGKKDGKWIECGICSTCEKLNAVR